MFKVQTEGEDIGDYSIETLFFFLKYPFFLGKNSILWKKFGFSITLDFFIKYLPPVQSNVIQIEISIIFSILSKENA
jgi:hypothetical protein